MIQHPKIYAFKSQFLIPLCILDEAWRILCVALFHIVYMLFCCAVFDLVNMIKIGYKTTYQ
jgi:hypothetical protein